MNSNFGQKSCKLVFKERVWGASSRVSMLETDELLISGRFYEESKKFLLGGYYSKFLKYDEIFLMTSILKQLDLSSPDKE